MNRVLAVVMFFIMAGCSNEPVLSVLGMKDDLTKYTRSKVTMEGIVSTWQSQDKDQFGIVDIKESKQKSQFVIPVRYSGDKPLPGTKVQVTGIASVEAREFKATELTVIK